MPNNNCLPRYMYSCPLSIVRDKTRAYKFGFRLRRITFVSGKFATINLSK